LYETGYNGDGELGNGSQADLLTLTKIADNVSSVGAGLYHSLYVTTGGVLMGSGINNMGQLGTATASYFTSFQQMDIGVGSVVASGGYTLYLKGAGRLYGCGTNASGELGRTDTTTLWSPTLLDSNVNGISAGWMFSLRTKSSNSTLWGTGDDEYGQLGNNSFSNRWPRDIHIPLSSLWMVRFTRWGTTSLENQDAEVPRRFPRQQRS
jgi:alpha-tubulin suppressor-like RCC1 family protein